MTRPINITPTKGPPHPRVCLTYATVRSLHPQPSRVRRSIRRAQGAQITHILSRFHEIHAHDSRMSSTVASKRPGAR